MSINQIIKAAISPIVPVCEPIIYSGSATEYCTFNYTELPALHGDNAPGAIRYLIQLHWFLPNGTNPMAKKRQIKNALLLADCTYPDVTNASDAEGQHFVFECEFTDGDV